MMGTAERKQDQDEWGHLRQKTPQSYDMLHRRMSKTLTFGDMVDYFPRMLSEAIECRIWEHRNCRKTGKPFKNLLDYVTHHAPDGLQVNPDRIEQLISHDAAVLTAWREATTRKVGAAGHMPNSDIITIKPARGTSAAYTLERLKRESPALYDAVVRKELSANAAAVQAGLRKKPTPFETAKRVLPMLSDEEWERLCELRAKRGAA